MIWIVTDTAQELKSRPTDGLAVISLPLIVNSAEQAEPMEPERFYELLADDSVELKTSQATPAKFQELFEELTANGDEVVAVLLSSKLSGTFNSARLAALETEGVYLVDTEEACLSQTALVKRAMQLRDEGLDAAGIADRLNQEKEDVVLLAAIPSLKYLKKGGRISPAAAAVGDLVGVKPIVTINADGDVAVAAKTRGLKKAIKKTAEMADDLQIDFLRPVVVGYSGTDTSNAEKLKEEVENLTGQKISSELHSLSPVLAVHAGPDAAGIGFFRKKQ